MSRFRLYLFSLLLGVSNATYSQLTGKEVELLYSGSEQDFFSGVLAAADAREGVSSELKLVNDRTHVIIQFFDANYNSGLGLLLNLKTMELSWRPPLRKGTPYAAAHAQLAASSPGEFTGSLEYLMGKIDQGRVAPIKGIIQGAELASTKASYESYMLELMKNVYASDDFKSRFPGLSSLAAIDPSLSLEPIFVHKVDKYGVVTAGTNESVEFKVKGDASLRPDQPFDHAGVEVITNPYDPTGSESRSAQALFETIESFQGVYYNNSAGIHEHFGVVLPSEFSSEAFEYQSRSIGLSGQFNYDLKKINDFSILEKMMPGLEVVLDYLALQDPDSGKSVLDLLQNEFLGSERHSTAKPLSSDDLARMKALVVEIKLEFGKSPPDFTSIEQKFKSLLEVQGSRYSSINLQSLLTKGTVEFRMYDSNSRNLLVINQVNAELAQFIKNGRISDPGVFRFLKSIGGKGGGPLLSCLLGL